MLHNRRWDIWQEKSIDDLAVILTKLTWLRCRGFQLEGYLWLSDTISMDGIQEYAVVRMPNKQSNDFLQVESVTVGWCDKQKLADTISWIHSGSLKPKADSRSLVATYTVADLYEALDKPKELKPVVVYPRIETPAEHGQCELCV